MPSKSRNLGTYVIDNTGALGMRNRIINGAMIVDQRNAGASQTITTANAIVYTIDRWGIFASQASKISCQRSTTAPPSFTNSHQLTVASAVTAGASETYVYVQPIEGYNVSDLSYGTANAQTVTISFWFRSSITGNYAVSIRNSAANRSYVRTITVNSADTFAYYTITIPGCTDGTWNIDNNIGMYFSIDLGSGSSFNGTETWSTGNFFRTSTSANWLANAGATMFITGVQLETGLVATPFERRPIGQELALCQRYYEKSYDQTVVPGTASTAGSVNLSSNGVGYWSVSTPFAVVKRIAAIVTPYSTVTGASGKIRQTTSNVDLVISINGGTAGLWQASGPTGNNAFLQFQWVASAEL